MGTYKRDLRELAKILRVLRTQGKEIAFLAGCFDFLHAGTVRCLLDAANRCDLLVVGIYSDAAAKKLLGPGRPLQTAAERAEILGALNGVHYITTVDPANMPEVLRSLRPSAVLKGLEYDLSEESEQEAVRDIGARVVTLNAGTRNSTKSILERFVTATGRSGKSAGTTGKPKAMAAVPSGKKPALSKAPTKKALTKKVASKAASKAVAANAGRKKKAPAPIPRASAKAKSQAAASAASGSSRKTTSPKVAGRRKAATRSRRGG